MGRITANSEVKPFLDYFRMADDPTGTINLTGIGSLKSTKLTKAQRGEAMAEDFFGKSHLMEVRLNIQSKLNLRPLADAFGSDVHVHFSKVVNGFYGVRLGLSEFCEFPDSTVISLCKAVSELPESARNLWNSASERTFDIGIEAAVCSTYWFALAPKTLNTLAALGARVVVTVYGPDSKEGESRADAIRHVQQADFEAS